jgi:hypothetical protein
MHRRQRGVTAIGWLFLLTPIAVVGYAGVRLLPVYLNYMKVAGSLEKLESGNSAEDLPGVANVRVAIERFLDVEGVEYPKAADILIRRDSGTWIVQAQYEDSAPLFSNISLLVAFDKTVTIR